eukprot:gene27206-2452_t
MAPKKKVDLPAVPPEANPEDTLPKEIKDLKEPPFTVQWQAVNSVMCLDPAIKADKLRETLSRKKLVRTPALFDLVLRLSPESELSTAIRVDLDEHLGAHPKTEHAVEVLKQRFERDRRIDWKLELHARQRALASSEEEVKCALASSEEEVKVSEAAVETAQAELAASEEALKVWEEEQEAARIASLDNEEDGGDDDVGDEPSEAQEAQEAALNSVEQCKLALVEAKEKLAAASSSQLEPFVKYQAYWIDGLGTESEAILSAVSQGLDLTSVVWAWPLPPSPPQAPEMWDVSEEGAVEGTGDVAKEEPSAEAEPAAEVSEPQPEPVYEPPPMYLAIKETVKNPDWNSPLALVVPLDVRLPPRYDTKKISDVMFIIIFRLCQAAGKEAVKQFGLEQSTGSGCSSGRASPTKEGKSKGKGKVEETPPQTPPLLDAPGWDILAQLFASISQHARAYREWRAKVVVHGTPKEAADAGPAPMDVYEALVQGVPQEQLSVPVLMHAMLEQGVPQEQLSVPVLMHAMLEQALVQGVPQEQLSVPVLKHAMLEQVRLSAVCPMLVGSHGRLRGPGSGSVPGAAQCACADACLNSYQHHMAAAATNTNTNTNINETVPTNTGAPQHNPASDVCGSVRAAGWNCGYNMSAAHE